MGVGRIVEPVAVERPSIRPHEVAHAREEVRVALAYVHRLVRRTGVMVRDEVLREEIVEATADQLDRSLARLTREEDHGGRRPATGAGIPRRI